MKRIIFIILILSLTFTGCNKSYPNFEEINSSELKEILRINNNNSNSDSMIFLKSNVTIDKTRPYIIVNCNYLLNKSMVDWENLNLSLEKDNLTYQVDMGKICNNLTNQND